MTDHPLPTGARVTHINQQWANLRSTPNGTAKIIEARGPYHDGSYEYLVLACRDFSRQPGRDNPMNRQTWWPSLAVQAGYPLPSDTCQCIPASQQAPRTHCDQHPRNNT